MTGALQGLTVIDTTRGVAGPYASRLLAEFGADVIKIEPPGGDPSRQFGPFPNDEPHVERSGLFLHLNRNKRSVVLDLATADGAATLRGLAATADILLEDFAPGQAEQWGWGWPTLAAINPKLVVTSITSFGQTGPYRDYRGSELTLQAIGGPLHANGHQDREPLKLGGHFAHYHGGICAALASMVALRRVTTAGEGDWIDLSLYECQAGCRDRRTIQLTIAAYTGLCAGRLTNTQRGFGVGVRECADGYVNIFAAGARLPRLLEMIGEHEAAHNIDPNAIDPQQRDVLEAAYQRWLANRSKRETVELAQAHGLLAGAFNSIADVVDDPHYAARNVWDIVEHPQTGPLKYPGRPFTMSAAGRATPTCAPLLDEHGAAIRNSTQPLPAPETAIPNTGLALPLEGIRVAEITVVWAGPHVTQLLGEWGADIVRVEPSNRVQPFTRGMERVPTPEQARDLAASGAPIGYPDNDPGADPWNRSAAFNSHARNKRSMACDIMTPEGHEAVLRLIQQCDVLVENNVPETIDKAGLGWETLHQLNPRLIMLRMPAFALDGPYRNFRAFGLHVEAMIGHTLLRGYPDAGPDILSESLASDGISGAQGALAIMMALKHRDRTGEGQLIELPLTEGFLPTLGEYVMDYTMNGRDTPPQGNQHRWHAPHNVYACRGDDNWIAIEVADDAEFASLCGVLGDAALAQSELYASAALRRQNIASLDAAIAELTADADKEKLFHSLQAAGVCAAPTHDPLEALSDPQLEARGFFERLATGRDGGTHLYPGLMWRMRRTPNHLRTPPVLLGEHNQEIYRELGYDAEELNELEQRGLVADTFPTTIWQPDPG